MPGRGASATPGSARAAPPAAPRAVGGREVGALRAAPPTDPSEEALRTRCEPIAHPLRAMGAQRVAVGAQRGATPPAAPPPHPLRVTTSVGALDG